MAAYFVYTKIHTILPNNNRNNPCGSCSISLCDNTVKSLIGNTGSNQEKCYNVLFIESNNSSNENVVIKKENLKGVG